MFPHSGTITEVQMDEITRWNVDMLQDAFQERWERFLKVLSTDGTPVGFCGWTVISRKSEEVINHEIDKEPKKEKPKKKTWVPETLDVDAWITISKALRAERERVLKDLDNICRKLNYITTYSYLLKYLLTYLGLTFMAVSPNHQRQGIGSMMMERICKEIDQYGRCAYVLAAPEGVRLYAKFGFKAVGSVETPQGTITSMFRQSRQL